MPNEYKTPGVYIEEIGALPPSIPAVETALPVFLGYVAEAEAYGEPVPIASLVEYESLFGGPPPESEAKQWRLHEAIRLHYIHGGQTALVVPLGAHDEADAADPAPFHAALDRIAREQGPTLLLAPDALLLSREDYHGVAAAMLELCAALGDRMAILDIHGGGDPAIATAVDSAPLIQAFRDAVAPLGPALSYGATYDPWLVSPDGQRMPPSGAMAGIYRQVDGGKGVWKAPANVALDGGAVAAPAVRYSNAEQENLNAPPGGLSVNAIRSFAGRGTLVWGARTLDGNSVDYRYIPVRRTLIWLEQSIRQGIAPFVFEPNDASTWVKVRAMIENFLTDVWRQGGLMGSTAKDGFWVQCGLGQTMTAQDLLDNFLVVGIGVAPIRPAEFIVLTIRLEMAPS